RETILTFLTIEIKLNQMKIFSFGMTKTCYHSSAQPRRPRILRNGAMAVQKYPAEVLLTRHARRNFWLNVSDGMAFVFGMSMVSRLTVLPLFVSRLSGERWVQGLIPTLQQTGWVLPALFMAPLVASLPRRKSLIMTA